MNQTEIPEFLGENDYASDEEMATPGGPTDEMAIKDCVDELSGVFSNISRPELEAIVAEDYPDMDAILESCEGYKNSSSSEEEEDDKPKYPVLQHTDVGIGRPEEAKGRGDRRHRGGKRDRKEKPFIKHMKPKNENHAAKIAKREERMAKRQEAREAKQVARDEKRRLKS